MGTFQGHALPGTFFILFGIWWSIQIARRLAVCKIKGIGFYNTQTYPCFCMCANFPIEGVVKVLITSVGMVAEGAAATVPLRSGNVDRMGDLHGFWIGDIQHVTMYLFFFISGILDILVFLEFKYIPPGIDYASSVLAFTVEGILFAFHLHGRDQLDVTLHMLLLYTIGACVLSCMFEYKYSHSVYAVLSRTFFTFLQGTWFWQVGLILYPPFSTFSRWDAASHENIMFSTVLYCWHIFVLLLLMSILIGATYHLSIKYFPPRKGSKEYELTGKQLKHAESAESFALTHLTGSVLDSDNEEETVFDSSNLNESKQD